MEHSLKDEASILTYQLHRNDSLNNLCFCEACKTLRKKINLLQLSDIRRMFGEAA